MFRGLLVEKDDQGYRTSLSELGDDRLAPGEVVVAVEYSTLNFKDALAITGKGPVLKAFPIIPGIDLAGTVASSNDPRCKVGEKVLVNGCGIGERVSGGLSERARVMADWVVPLPAAFSTRQAMAIGTAGFTAMLSVLALERNGVRPDQGEILVTGATGGVGSIAVAILAKLGYQVVAVSGRPEHGEYLRTLGAAEILDRKAFSQPGKPLARERWAGAVDAVGSHTLVNVCAAVKARGVVAACGLAQGMDFPATVAPFILRAITLVGIESGSTPTHAERVEAWQRLAKDLDAEKLESMTGEVPLSQAIETSAALLGGKVRGRLVVDINA